MKTLTFLVDDFNATGRHNSKIEISLSNVDIAELVDQIGTKELMKYIRHSEALEIIDNDTITDYLENEND